MSFVMLGGAHQAFAQGVAVVLYTQGDTFIDRAGVLESLSVGATVPEGALLKTGPEGHLYLRLADDGFLVLRPKTVVRIPLYLPVPEHPSQSAFQLELVQGVARAITGKVAEQAKERFRFNTPLAAIGVKGTDFVVSVTSGATFIMVNAGAVVASQFTADCTRAGLGPCSSDTATTLSASKDLLLSITASHLGAKTLDIRANPAYKHMMPDIIAPPASHEDSLPGKRTDRSSLTDSILSRDESLISTANLLPAPVVPPVAVASVVPKMSEQQIFWGRWAPVANLGPGTDLAEFVKGLEPLGISWPSYVVARQNDALVMPGAGVVHFGLSAFEAGFYLDNNAGAAVAAQITNPTLSVDFGKKTFVTQFSLDGGGYTGNFVAMGNLVRNGVFEANAGRSNMTLAGGLAGSPADQAAYIFSGRVGPQVIGAGGTFWRKRN
ncbi:FecR family protein [Rhodoferax sp.]|uniref:FecR family protein n=1 Tax=Rhodoferax sp. TaxID=50421 RepID=UPI0026161E74|nr:FecR family protein [Rhodoferax sp.]MDD5478442.1 FecR family protein [Rhodoferax sp.]